MNFIYSADLTFRVFRKMNFIGLNPHATDLVLLTPVPANFCTTCNAPYVDSNLNGVRLSRLQMIMNE